MKHQSFHCALRISALRCCVGLLPVAGTASVWAANQGPMVSQNRDMTVYVREPVRFAVDASDPDNDPLIYSVSGLPSGAAIGESTGGFSWDPTIADTGAHTATFTVSDGVTPVSMDVAMTVVMPSLAAGQATRVLRPNGGETYRYGDTLNVAFVTLSCSDEAQVIVQYGNYYRNKWLYTSQNTERLQLDGNPVDSRGVACRYFYPFPEMGVNVGFYRLALRDTSIVTALGRPLSFGGDSAVVDSLKVSINDPYGSEGPCADPAQGSGVLNGDLSDQFFTVMPRSHTSVSHGPSRRYPGGSAGPRLRRLAWGESSVFYDLRGARIQTLRRPQLGNGVPERPSHGLFIAAGEGRREAGATTLILQ